MDFSIPDELLELKQRTERFVADEIIPREADPRQGAHGPSEAFRRELIALARARGLVSPHVGREWGGLGLDHRGRAVVFEAAGYSPLAPIAMNCFAPDEANMHLLEQVAEHHQKEEWLRPLAAGAIRSCFMMTEPAPGAGADPSMLTTTARRVGGAGGNTGDFIIDGTKWLITGAVGAEMAIIMAKNDSDPLGPAGATMFLAPMSAPGIVVERVLDTLDQYMAGGHAVIRLDGLRVPETAVLGRVGEGFRYAQARLAPARLTHCMRWLGFSKRCMEIAQEYVGKREAFGVKLADRENIQIKLGEIAHQIEIGRLLTMHAAWKLDQGSRARKEVSMAKIQVADTLHNAADVAIQVNGARGYSKDTILEWVYRYARAARLVDGASEVHKMVLARFMREQGRDFWQWGPGEGRRNAP